MARILIVTGDAGESYETLYALHRLRESNHTAVLAAPSKRRLHLVMHDFEPGWDTYVERPGYAVEPDLAFPDVDPSQYDAILLIGGRAPEYLRNNATLLDITRHFQQSNKWIFAICHGIQILAAAGVIHNRQITCYEHVRFEAEQAGGTWCTAQAIRDGNIVTGQTWQSHPEFYRELIACLASPHPLP